MVNPNLIMPTVLTEAARAYVNLGYQDIAGRSAAYPKRCLVEWT